MLVTFDFDFLDYKNPNLPDTRNPGARQAGEAATPPALRAASASATVAGQPAASHAVPAATTLIRNQRSFIASGIRSRSHAEQSGPT